MVKDPEVLLKGSGKGRGALVGALIEISAVVGGRQPEEELKQPRRADFFLQLCMQPVLLKYCLAVKDPEVLLRDPGKGRGH